MSAVTTIRLAKGVRIYIGMFAALSCAFGAVGFVSSAIDGSAGVLFFGFIFAMGAFWFLRWMRVAVVADSFGLMVRNAFSTKRIPWADIEAFRISSRAFSWSTVGALVYMLRRDGSMTPLDATARSHPFPGGARRVERNLELLRAAQASATSTR